MMFLESPHNDVMHAMGPIAFDFFLSKPIAFDGFMGCNA
jgi:hypothetical protein